MSHERGAASGKGPTRGHVFKKLDHSATHSVLTAAGLLPCATHCKLHSRAVEVACTTCSEPALCTLCGVSSHSGHTLIVLVEAAPVARQLLRSAVSPSDAVTLSDGAKRLAAELDALPGRVVLAEQHIDELRDMLIASVVARHASLRFDLAAAATAAQAGLTAELQQHDTLISDVNAAAASVTAAADGLCDADAVAHVDALVTRATIIREAVAAQPAPPMTATIVSLDIDGGAQAALLQAIAGAGRVSVRRSGEEAAAHDGPTSTLPSAAATVVSRDSLQANQGGAAVSTTAAAPPVSRASAVPKPPTLNEAAAAAGITLVSTRSTELSKALGEFREELDCLAARKELPSLRDFSIAECRAKGYDACLVAQSARIADIAALKAAGFDAAMLKAGGFDATALRSCGFNLESMKNAGFGAAALKAAGFEASRLLASGFDVTALRAASFTAMALKACGLEATTLKEAGYDAAALKTAAFDAPALRAAGISSVELRAAGFDVGQLFDAGWRCQSGHSSRDNAISHCFGCTNFACCPLPNPFHDGELANSELVVAGGAASAAPAISARRGRGTRVVYDE